MLAIDAAKDHAVEASVSDRERLFFPVLGRLVIPDDILFDPGEAEMVPVAMIKVMGARGRAEGGIELSVLNQARRVHLVCACHFCVLIQRFSH